MIPALSGNLLDVRGQCRTSADNGNRFSTNERGHGTDEHEDCKQEAMKLWRDEPSWSRCDPCVFVLLPVLVRDRPLRFPRQSPHVSAKV